MLTDGSENLFYLAYGMPQSRTSRRADAKQSNNALLGSENYIQNAKWVNALLLKTIEYGRDSLSEEEIEQLETLAKSCPSIEGLAVYKARMLYTFYEPTLDYNDYTICNPQNKNGSGLFNDLMSFLNNPNGDNTKQLEQGIQKCEQYKIYPIPTNDQLTIEYDFVGNNDAKFILVDILGREMLQTSLKNENTKVSISTLNLPLGVYMYKIHVGKGCYNGKIIKR